MPVWDSSGESRWDTLDQTFPHHITNPAQQTETLYYHAGLGPLAVLRDLNGLTTTVKFDRFGHPRLMDVPSSADISINYELTPDGLLRVKTTRVGGATSAQYFDKWGHAVRSEVSRLNGAMAVVENTFTRLNRLASISFPQYTSSTGPGIQLLPASIALRYDNLGRIRQQVVSAGGLPGHDIPGDIDRWTYDGLVQTHVDPRGIESTIETDGASRIIRVATIEPDVPPRNGVLIPLPRRHQVVSRYEYGPFNALKTLIDPAGNRTEIGYDILGRQIESTNPSGDGATFKLESVWDGFDRLQYLKYPVIGSNQLVLEYGYDPNSGILNSVRNQATKHPYWRLSVQDASGAVLTEQFGPSITTNRSLDGQERLTSVITTATRPGSATSAPRVLQKLSYDYGPGSLIAGRHSVPDNDAIATEKFDYDFLGRLLHWTVEQRGLISEQAYGYDDLGNLTSMSVDSGTGRTVINKYGPTPSSPNAGPYAISESQENGANSVYQYDLVGRQISGGSIASITWNAFDLPSRIQSATQSVSFKYDADGRRTIKKTGSAGDIIYIGGSMSGTHRRAAKLLTSLTYSRREALLARLF